MSRPADVWRLFVAEFDGNIGIALDYLDNWREQKVLRMRFGLDDGRSRTLEEVGREVGVTRERIRQIEAKALHKMLCYVSVGAKA